MRCNSIAVAFVYDGDFNLIETKRLTVQYYVFLQIILQRKRHRRTCVRMCMCVR